MSSFSDRRCPEGVWGRSHGHYERDSNPAARTYLIRENRRHPGYVSGFGLTCFRRDTLFPVVRKSKKADAPTRRPPDLRNVEELERAPGGALLGGRPLEDAFAENLDLGGGTISTLTIRGSLLSNVSF